MFQERPIPNRNQRFRSGGSEGIGAGGAPRGEDHSLHALTRSYHEVADNARSE